MIYLHSKDSGSKVMVKVVLKRIASELVIVVIFVPIPIINATNLHNCHPVVIENIWNPRLMNPIKC